MSHLPSYRSHSYFTSFLFTLFNSSSHAVPKLRTSFSTPTPKKKLSILLYTQTIPFFSIFHQRFLSLFFHKERNNIFCTLILPLFYSQYIAYYIPQTIPFFSIFHQRFISLFFHKERNNIFYSIYAITQK